jgi:hypothetical protein
MRAPTFIIAAVPATFLISIESEATMVNEHGETFGQWLVAQADREGSTGELAKAAPKFPRRGGPDEVRARLNEMQADGDMHDAIDDAETDWLSY